MHNTDGPLLGGQPEEPANPALAALCTPLAERVATIEGELQESERTIEPREYFK
jgi:hypothetical protein